MNITECLRALYSKRRKRDGSVQGIPMEPEMIEVVNASADLGINTIKDAVDLMRTLNLILKPMESAQVYPGW